MDGVNSKEWYSAAELSFLNLAIFPSSRFGIQKKFAKENRTSRVVDGQRGGKSGATLEYLLTADELVLVQQAQQAIALINETKSEIIASQTLTVAEPQNPTELMNW